MTFLLTAALLLVFPLLADSPAQTPRARWHFVVNGKHVKEYSLHFQRTAEADQTRVLLVADAGRFDFHSWQDPTEKDNRESVVDIATGLKVSRRLLFGAYGKVRGCGSVRLPDACVIFEAPLGTVATSMTRLGGADGDAIRRRVQAAIPKSLQDKLLALDPAYSELNELAPWSDDFLGMVWPGKFRDPSRVGPRGRRVPGCDWDAEFGYPCTEKERRHEESRPPTRGPAS